MNPKLLLAASAILLATQTQRGSTSRRRKKTGRKAKKKKDAAYGGTSDAIVHSSSDPVRARLLAQATENPQSTLQQRLKLADNSLFFGKLPEVARLKNAKWFDELITAVPYDEIQPYNLVLYNADGPYTRPLLLFMHKSYWPQDIIPIYTPQQRARLRKFGHKITPKITGQGKHGVLDNPENKKHLTGISSSLSKAKADLLPLQTPYDEDKYLISPYTIQDHYDMALGQLSPRKQHQIRNDLVTQFLLRGKKT